jgi:hypothetical protein
MELFKITIGIRKKFYESKKTFEQNWKYHIEHWSKWCYVIAYQIDWKNQCWKEIRRVNQRFER